ncbi:MAG: hypothetical protein A3I29_01565 [Candidatus Magasanikbacteria bacterium RIFCSPLOWO2_02_FULL_44_11]|uniref:Transcriptional regulator n=2 Tax=Candidatus Magasanikiibacteriota TaxID=1752731 RepID=A0A1F6NA72_9BACT|nr:MAG: hypothetical protein A3D53_00135 [Candidatus Magasanikbacteria bacterium RIFCSPHIGHO2_02_FULL_45_10]OGH80769.1 MAG: hypothetical protein A3I29_01565 [Candidatus Magasanikbacteria bacterium RIFCSPLOWO2_02_FULL_44_11]
MLEHFFGSKTRLKLLKTFFRHPERAFYVRELARLIGTQLHAVRREVANLGTIGLIKHLDHNPGPKEIGTERSKFFQLNTSSTLYPEMKALLMKGEMLDEQHLVDDIKEKGGDISLLMLTGQFVHDPEVETDILLVGKIKPIFVAKRIKNYESDMQKVIRYTIMDDKEFNDRRQIGDRFLFSLFEAKHLMMIDNYGIN